MFYLYEKSYSFPVQIAVSIGFLLSINTANQLSMVMFELAMYCVGFILVQLIFYALYEKMDNKNTLKPAKNVPLMLFTLSIVSLLLYVVGTLL